MTTPATNQRSGYNPATPVDQPLNAQQIQALAKQQADALTAIKRDVELRKWAVDQACGLAGAAYEAESDTHRDVVAVARAIHAFLVEGTEKQA